jgi:hypothetical protein
MSRFTQLMNASVLALAASAPGAFAAVTAEDVWAQWQSWLTAGGQTVAVGAQQKSGNTLTLTDVKVSMSTPEGTMDGTMATLTFTENGDGTVTVTLPPEYPIALTMTPTGEPQGKMDMVVRQTNLTTIASGDPANISYALAGEQLVLDITAVQTGGDEPLDMKMAFTVNGISGSYNVVTAGAMTVTSTANAASVAIDLDVKDPAGAGTMVLNGSFTNLTSSSTATLPAGANYNDMPAMLAAGFDVSANLNYGPGTFRMDFTDAGQQMSMEGSGESGGLDMAMAPGGLSYNTRSSGLDVTVSGAGMPPVAARLAEAAFGLTMPIAKSDSPQDVALLVRLVDLSVGEELWGLIDPTGALPHDPATLIIDIAGTANWLVDIMAPDAQAQMAAGMPGMLHSLDLKELRLAIAGADLSGEGAFTFSPDETFAWGGMLAPEGSVNLTLVGANALVDKLVAMGLIQQDMAMQGRMMMGMIARPGDGPDTLVSTIEVKKEGSVFANGMQLK